MKRIRISFGRGSGGGVGRDKSFCQKNNIKNYFSNETAASAIKKMITEGNENGLASVDQIC